jgi:hypothetical protein
MSCTRSYHAVFSKYDASKDMFPAYRKECLADKRTGFQCWMTVVVFGEKIEDYFFNLEGKYGSRRHENYGMHWGKRAGRWQMVRVATEISVSFCFSQQLTLKLTQYG